MTSMSFSMRSVCIVAMLLVASLELSRASGPGIYGSGSKVAVLTQQNFEKLVTKSEAVWIVKFYAPWCGHCRSLQPEYDAAAKMMNGIIRFGAVNCEDNRGQNLCQKHNIQAYPTILIFRAEKMHKDKQPRRYNGRHDRQALVNSGLNFLNADFVMFVNDDNVDSFLDASHDGLARAILFTDKPTTTHMFKSLALNVKDRMVCGESRDAPQLMARFGVVSFPTLIVVTQEGKMVPFKGKLSFPSLMDFLKEHALMDPDNVDHYKVLGVTMEASDADIKKAYRKLSLMYHPDKNAGDKTKAKMFEMVGAAYELLSDENQRAIYDQELDSLGGEVDADFYKRNKDITNIQSWWQFNQLINNGAISLVEFYTPWCPPCIEFSAEYKRLPMALEGLNIDKKVQLIAVNCAKQEETCNRLGVRSYPTVRMLKQNEGGFETYNGEKTANEVAQWVADSLDSPVVDIYTPRQFGQLVDRSKELWIVDFYSPRCGPCQAIKGDVRRMASKMRGLAKVAMFSCVESEQHQQFCNDKGVNGFPTIMAFGRSAQGGVKQGVELEMSQNGYPAVSAMQIAATILELNKAPDSGSGDNTNHEESSPEEHEEPEESMYEKYNDGYDNEEI